MRRVLRKIRGLPSRGDCLENVSISETQLLGSKSKTRFHSPGGTQVSIEWASLEQETQGDH